MNEKEYLLRAKIKRRGNAVKKLEVELERFAEVLYNLPDDNEKEKTKILSKMAKYRTRIDEYNAERKALIQKVVNIP
jgi:hypothetical protein